MLDILLQTGNFIAVILLGIFLRSVGVFKKEDFRILSKICLRITLPASIIVSVSGRQVDPALFGLILLGLAGGVIYMVIGYLINLKKSRQQKAFDILNLPGYNIGCFSLPLMQCFFGPMGVITTSLFDAGNGLVVLGGAYAVAESVKNGHALSGKAVVKILAKSVPMVACVGLMIMSLLHITLPAPILSLAEMIAGANAFVAMLMIGIGFEFSGKKKQLGAVCRILGLRYGIAGLLSVIFYFTLPFSFEIRKVLAILVFSPIGAAVPAFTAELGEDVGLSSAVNSISIVISIVIMVTLISVLR